MVALTAEELTTWLNTWWSEVWGGTPVSDQGALNMVQYGGMQPGQAALLFELRRMIAEATP